MKTFETERIILRPWQKSDAEALFKYASEAEVGLPCGWRPHKDIEESKFVLEKILMVPETYAIVLKETGEAVGSISLMMGGRYGEEEAEIGYWLGKPHWGKGIMPEAVKILQNYAFCDLGKTVLWCGYFTGNDKSRRVSEKCGFRYHHTEYGVMMKQLGETRDVNKTVIYKNEWEKMQKNS
ncbi:MAG: GNAT family N-acetyltransferase [Clostridia bacterium]|nr:GNAT family N-acetyltransferase [Clostridia bacterium]